LDWTKVLPSRIRAHRYSAMAGLCVSQASADDSSCAWGLT